ncbi:MAG: outer membrane lipid asymmetry maintenance protein MlaD [Paracoccaceae bacterium]
MSENPAEIAVGGVVLAGAIGFLVYAGQLTGFSDAGAAYHEYSASFRSIEGVSVGTDVRMAGVKVGSVTSLVLNPETFRAEAGISVKNSVMLPDDTAAVVSSEGLLGGNFVELLAGGSLENLAPGAEIEDTQSAVGLVELLLKFASGNGGN